MPATLQRAIRRAEHRQAGVGGQRAQTAIAGCQRDLEIAAVCLPSRKLPRHGPGIERGLPVKTGRNNQQHARARYRLQRLSQAGRADLPRQLDNVCFRKLI